MLMLMCFWGSLARTVASKQGGEGFGISGLRLRGFECTVRSSRTNILYLEELLNRRLNNYLYSLEVPYHNHSIMGPKIRS